MWKWLVIGVAGLCLVGGGLLAWWLWPASEVTTPQSGDPAHVNEEPKLAFEALEEPTVTDAGVRPLVITVHDETGEKPIAGATVEVYAEASSPYEALRCQICDTSAFDCHHADTTRLMLDAVRAGRVRMKPLASGVTDASGQVALVDVPDVQVLIVAKAKGLRGSTSSAPDLDENDVLLRPSRLVTQRVTSPADVSLADARLTVFDLQTFEVHEQVTGSDGQTNVEVFDGSMVWVAAEKPGFMPSSQLILDEVPLVLTEPRPLVVHTRLGGKPVDAEVAIDGLHPRKLRAVNGELAIDDLHDANTLQATAQGLVSQQYSLETLLVPGQAALKELTIELRAASRLMVTIVDERGQPVQDAQADLSNDSMSTSANGSNGELAVLGPVPEGDYHLSVFAAGFREHSQQIDLHAGDQDLEVMLKGTVQVTGVVVDLTGKPVTDAQVSVNLSLGTMNEGSSTGVSDEGVFELQLNEPGEWTIEAESRTKGIGSVRVKVPAAGPVRIQLDPHAELEVKLVSESGEPVQGVVTVANPLSSAQSNPSDEQGVAHFSGLEPGQYTLLATCDGLLAVSQPVQLEDHRLQQVRITMSKGVEISGKVVDEAGKPISGATVFTDGELGTASSGTGDDGTFVLAALQPGHEYEVSAYGNDGAIFGDGKKIKAPATDVVLTGKAPRSVHGRVVDDSGKVVTNFEVNERPFESPDGRFEIAVSGTSLSVWADSLTAASIELKGNDDLGDVVLNRYRQFEGVVVDADGRPVAGATVTAVTFAADATTNAEGHFSTQLAAEEQTFEVSAHRGLMRGTANVKVGGLATIVLNRAAKVTGTVLGPDGRPLSTTVFVSAVNMAIDTIRVDSRGDGRFELQLSEGRWSFATRAAQAEQIFDVRGPVQEIVLGGTGSTCAVTVNAHGPIGEAWLVPASLAAQVTKPGQDSSADPPPGTVRIGSPVARSAMRAASVPCADYVLVAYFNAGVATVPVSLHGGEVTLDVDPPVRPSEPQGALPQ